MKANFEARDVARSSGRDDRAACSISRRYLTLMTVALGGLIQFLVLSQARAADGCLVLLCFAAPSWHNIPQCIDPVRDVLWDVSRGHPFPSCSTAGTGNTATNQWSSAPTFCPPQYTRSYEVESGTVFTCDFDGAVAIDVGGSLWSRTWWSLSGGDTVTEFSANAKAQLGSWETRFDDDYASWLASRPPTAPTYAGD